MHPVFEKLEHFFDIMVVPALLLIGVIVVLEIFFTETAHHYDEWVNFADFIVILVFTGDLSFKFHRASRWEGFLKSHWLEIIAIMPFFWVFRIFDALNFARGGLEIGQEAAHLAEGARSGRFAEIFRSSELARSSRFSRFIRIFARTPRFAKAAEFFKHPRD